MVCDEAHKMSATVFGGETKYTKRYRLGQLLSTLTRHFLLMSATPHDGKEADFQLFMALLDGDRFEGRFRDGVHYADTADMMRRLTKEELLRFDARPLFSERRAYTAKYELSPEEAALYAAVTDYVRTEMNRVARFADGDGRKQNNVGFALQILQRRLASSPAAIHRSLKRRRERLERELTEAKLAAKGRAAGFGAVAVNNEILQDLDEYGQDEIDDLEDLVVTGATTAETVEQLSLEVDTLKVLEGQALGVLHSGDARAFELKEQERAGKKTRLNWENAERRATGLAQRGKRRMALLGQEKFISSLPPRVRGGMIVIPRGLLASSTPSTCTKWPFACLLLRTGWHA